MARVQRIAAQRKWTRHSIAPDPEPGIIALHRDVPNPDHTIYISSGIHGDEPAGPLAALALLNDDFWPANLEVWLIPCLNPSGFALNSRANATGHDLNRDYRRPASGEVRAHVRLLERLPRFDFCICLHEDWEAKGFYLYEVNMLGGESSAESVIAAVAKACPIDPSPFIDGRPARDGIIRPQVDPAGRPDWPEAFYLIQHKTKLSFTLEAPSDFAMGVRVQALVAAVKTIIASVTVR